MNKEITTILTLYKTPLNMIKNLEQYRDFNLMLFEQNVISNQKKKFNKVLKFKFKYFSSTKNEGLSKSSNFLLSKVRTKYCLFTQPDIFIKSSSINKLLEVMKKKKDAIFITPSFSKKINKTKMKLKATKNVNAACMLCDVKKLNKIGFYDEDFFLYWEDIYLMNKVNKSNYKMYVAEHIFAKHESSTSSINSTKTIYIRNSNFIYGELLYDFKLKKLRYIKIFRKLIQNLLLVLYNIVSFQFIESIRCVAKINGIFKFMNFRLQNLI